MNLFYQNNISHLRVAVLLCLFITCVQISSAQTNTESGIVSSESGLHGIPVPRLAKKSVARELPIGLNLLKFAPDKSKYLNTDRDGKGLAFIYVPFNSTPLNNYLDTLTSAHGNFDNNYMMIGLDDVSNNSRHADVISCLGIILPQKISAGPADSVQLKLHGWHHTVSILGWDFIPGETVTFALGTAWSYGNLKIRRTINGQKTRYTNPFVAPGGRAEFRLVFGNFYFGGRATYRYDITHTLWKRKNDLMPVLPEYDNTGMAYFGYLGLIF